MAGVCLMTGRTLKFILTAALEVAVYAPLLLAQDADNVLAGHKSRIKELIEAKEWSAAIEAAERALADYPNKGELLFLKITAVAEQNKIKTENTIKSLERSITFGNDSHAVHRNLASEYLRNSKY